MEIWWENSSVLFRGSNPNTFLHTCHNQNPFSATAHMTAAHYSRLCEKHNRKASFFMIWVRVMRAARLRNSCVPFIQNRAFSFGFLLEVLSFTWQTQSVWFINNTWRQWVSFVNCNNQLQSGVKLFRTELYWLDKRQMKSDSVQAVGRSPSYSKT